MSKVLNIEDLEERVLATIDPDLFVEILEISTEELIDVFEDRMVEKVYKFLDEDEEFSYYGE